MKIVRSNNNSNRKLPKLTLDGIDIKLSYLIGINGMINLRKLENENK